MKISVTVDGVRYDDEVEPRLLLVHYLGERAGRTGMPIGCDTSNCGACTVLLNGRSIKSCSVLAVQADGAAITTIQGLAGGPGRPASPATGLPRGARADRGCRGGVPPQERSNLSAWQ
jgi:carbon-monoxide dehydrogenase small subunit